MAMPKGHKVAFKEEAELRAVRKRKNAALAWAAKHAKSAGPLPIGNFNICWLEAK